VAKEETGNRGKESIHSTVRVPHSSGLILPRRASHQEAHPARESIHTLVDTRNSLHACKFLDLPLVLTPDEFQLHEWPFVTDRLGHGEGVGAGIMIKGCPSRKRSRILFLPDK
jgi:hypothetical protein